MATLGVTANPRDHQVEEGAERYIGEGCDVVVVLGGGSPVDAAKILGIGPKTLYRKIQVLNLEP